MKRLTFALGLAAAAAFAAPLAAQTRSQGPWWDPANTGTRSGTVDSRNGQVNNDGRIYDTRSTDGQWRRAGRDGNGNYIYVRNRYDNNGNLIQERARRDRLGRYQVMDRRVVQYANNRNSRNRNGGVYRDRDNDRNNDGWEDSDDDRDDRDGRDRNDRWDQNNGHDNGKHNGWYKNKNKNGKRRD
jgi:hypothetical protein